MSTIHAYHDPIALEALARNPNIVTDAHIDSLLLACVGIPTLRRSYAALLRLVSVTHDWEYPLRTPQKSQYTPYLRHEDTCDNPDAHECIERPKIDAGTPSIEQRLSDAHPVSNTDDLPRSKANAKLKDEVPCSVNDRAMVERALHEGIKAILHMRRQNDDPTAKKKPRTSPRSNLSITWLKRSTDIAARTLRSQLLVWSIHQRLLSAYDIVATLPVLHMSSPRKHTRPTHLPSAAARERLLREINELLPRMEEIGSRLTKRPRISRRRKCFFESDPWTVYLKRLQSSVCEDRKRKHAAGCAGHQLTTGTLDKAWRCCACLSYNTLPSSICNVCSSPYCEMEEAWVEDHSTLLNQRFKAVLSSGTTASTPWIFGQTVLPTQLRLPNGSGDSTLPVGGERRNVPIRPPHQNENRHLMLSKIANSPLSSPDDNSGMALPPGFDLVGRFNTTMSFGNPNHTVRNDVNHRAQGNCDTGQRLTPISNHANPVPTLRPSQVPPARLATSAPNGPSPMEMDMSRKIGIRMGSRGGREIPSDSDFSRGLNLINSSLDDNYVGIPLSTSVGVPPFLSPEGFASSLPHDISPIRSFGAASVYGSSLRRESHSKASSKKQEQTESNREPIRKAVFANSGLEELAQGSYEAVEDTQSSLMDRMMKGTAINIPPSNSPGEPSQDEIAAREALAAAIDAANGGTGSATKESLRAVSAVVSSGRGHSGSQSESLQNGTYNMF